MTRLGRPRAFEGDGVADAAAEEVAGGVEDLGQLCSNCLLAVLCHTLSSRFSTDRALQDAMDLDRRPRAASSSSDAALVEAVGDLLWGGGAGVTNVLNNWKEILVALGAGGVAHDGAGGVSHPDFPAAHRDSRLEPLQRQGQLWCVWRSWGAHAQQLKKRMKSIEMKDSTPVGDELVQVRCHAPQAGTVRTIFHIILSRALLIWSEGSVRVLHRAAQQKPVAVRTMIVVVPGRLPLWHQLPAPLLRTIQPRA